MMLRRFALIFPLISCAVACSSSQGSTGVGNPPLTSEEAALVEDGTEANGAGDTASAIVSVPAMVITKPEHVADATTAATISAFSKDLFLPQGCVTATQNATSITYDFAGCTGPLGLVNVEGTIGADFSAISGGVEAHVVSTGLTLDGSPASIDAVIDITFSGTIRTTTWNGTYTGKTPRGFPVTHKVADYVLTQDLSNSCISLVGTATSLIDRPNDVERTVESQVHSYERCGNRVSCPIAGGSITVTDQTTGKPTLSLTVTFDGGQQATIATPTKTTEVTLACTP